VRLPPFHWWRTVFFLIPAIAIYTIVLGTVSLISGVIDRSGTIAHDCARWWSVLILRTTGVTVDRRGAELPAASCVFVANHASIYDIPILFSALPKQLRIIAKQTLGHVPFVGWHLRSAGHLLVDRQNPGAAVLKKMRRLMAHRASLIVFPEGSRSSDGQIRRFKGGVFLLAIDNGLPVVPVSVSGSFAVMPKGRLMVCPAAVRVTVHEPISTTGLTREDARSLAERVHDVVAAAV
jgi:1-acyl-sn-glycerol-3-phosphate acyltransferase